MERPEAGPLQPQTPLVQNGHTNGCEKDSSSPDSAREKLALTPREKKISILEEPPRAQRGITGQFLSVPCLGRWTQQRELFKAVAVAAATQGEKA